MMKNKKILLFVVFAIVTILLVSCSVGGENERILYVKVSEFSLDSNSLGLVHEYRAELKNGNRLELSASSEDGVICTVDNFSDNSAELSFSAPLLVHEIEAESTSISVKAGETYVATAVGANSRYQYEFTITELDENETLTAPVGEYYHKMDVVSYTKYIAQVFDPEYTYGEPFSDHELLAACRYLCIENGDDLDLTISNREGIHINVPAAKMNAIVQNLFGVERELSEYANEVEKYGDYYLEYDELYKFFEDTEAWYFFYESAVSENDVITVSETPSGASVRVALERYPNEAAGKIGNSIIKLDVEYSYEKTVIDGFLYYRLKEIKTHGVLSQPLPFDDVKDLDKNGSFSVRDAVVETGFTENEISHIFVEDVTKDGENDVIVSFQGEHICVLDGYTMELYYPKVGVTQREGVVWWQDGDTFYVSATDGEKYSFLTSDIKLGIDWTFSTRDGVFSVDDGKIFFSADLLVNSYESIGDVECFLEFEDGAFVQKDTSFYPAKDRDVNFSAYTVDGSEKINITVYANSFWHEYSDLSDCTLYLDSIVDSIVTKMPCYETMKVLRAYDLPENCIFDENVYKITGTLDGGIAYYFVPSENCDIKVGKTESGLDYVSYSEHYDVKQEVGYNEHIINADDYVIHVLVRVSKDHAVLIRYRENGDKVSRVFESIEKIAFISCEQKKTCDRIGMENVEYTVDVSEFLGRAAAIYDTYKVTFNIGIRSDWKTYSGDTDKNGFFVIDGNGHENPRLLISGIYRVSSGYDLRESLKRYDRDDTIDNFLYGKTEKGYDYVIANYDHRTDGAYSAYVGVKISDEFVLNLVYHYYEGEGWAEVAESINMISFVSADKNTGNAAPKNAPAPDEVYGEYLDAYKKSLIFGCGLYGCSGKDDEKIEINGHTYGKSTDIESYAEFVDTLYSLFSKDVADSYIYLSYGLKDEKIMAFVDYNGQLYCYDGVSGPSGLFESGNITVVYESDTKIRVDAKYQVYSAFGAHRFMEADFKTVSYSYELIDGDWVFTAPVIAPRNEI